MAIYLHHYFFCIIRKIQPANGFTTHANTIRIVRRIVWYATVSIQSRPVAGRVSFVASRAFIIPVQIAHSGAIWKLKAKKHSTGHPRHPSSHKQYSSPNHQREQNEPLSTPVPSLPVLALMFGVECRHGALHTDNLEALLLPLMFSHTKRVHYDSLISQYVHIYTHHESPVWKIERKTRARQRSKLVCVQINLS